MECPLIAHPDTPSRAISDVIAEISRAEPDMLVIRYSALGDIGRLHVPEPVPFAGRQDGLWRTTCFEAFVMAEGGPSYLELNFSPSTGWAAYRFGSYRHDPKIPGLPPPHFDVTRLPDRLEVTVALDIGGLAELAAGDDWRVNLSAVIEEKDGDKSYWALAHPPGTPDFHHPDCFVLELPPAVER